MQNEGKPAGTKTKAPKYSHSIEEIEMLASNDHGDVSILQRLNIVEHHILTRNFYVTVDNKQNTKHTTTNIRPV